MKKKLDLTTWNRRDHFHFFNRFEEPFFGVTVQVDCTKAYAWCKENNASFFLYYLYQSLAAANRTEVFRYRIDSNNEVWVYDVIHASPTINRADGTFGFSYMDFHPSFAEFLLSALAETERVRNSTGLDPATSGENVIHYSAMPWLNFTAVQHARSFSFKDSCPKITFGKMTEQHGIKTMPVSIHAHHALMDGLHAAQFVALFQQLMNSQ